MIFATHDDHSAMLIMLTTPSRNFPQEIQDVLDEQMNPDSESYSPDFHWASAPVIVLYRGLGELPDYSLVCIPDGRIAQIYNINAGHHSLYSAGFEDYVQVMEVGRQAMLQGNSVVEAARIVWEHFAHKLPYDIDGPFELIDQLELIHEALQEDLKNSSPSGGGQPC